MKEIPTRPNPSSDSGATGRSTEAGRRPESESASSREKLEDTLGGALTRVLSRAGISVRVVPTGQTSHDAAGSGGAVSGAAAAPATASASEPCAAAEADAGSWVLPARDELITLLTMVVAGKVLGKLPAGALIENVAANGPVGFFAPEPGSVGSQPVRAVPPPAEVPWQAAPSPKVTGPAPPKRAPLRPPPVTAAPAPSAAGSKPAAAPTKGRGFTIRY